MRALGTTARHLLNSVATLPWLAPKNKLGGLSPSVFADFGRDKYALANVSPNLLTGNDLQSGLGSWTAVSGTVTASGGVMRIAGDGSGGRAQYTMTGLTVGKLYVLTFNFRGFNGTNIVYAVSSNASSTAANADMVSSTSGTGAKQLLFIANGTTRNVLVAIGNTALGNYADVSDFVVREITSTLGPNLVRNGDFATDLTGWTDASTAPSTVVWSGGSALTATDGTAAARIRQTIVTIPGRTYVFSHAGGAACAVGTTAGGQELLVFKQTASRTFVATGTTTYVSMATSGNALTLDDVSVREVLVGFGPELVANSGFDNDLSGWTDASAAGASFSWQSGRAVASTDGVAIARLRTSIATVVGRTYVVSVGGSGGVLIGTVIGQNDIMSVGGNLEKTFVATTTTTYVSYSNVANGIYLDFVSVREVLTNQPLQPVTLNELFSVSSGAKTVVANDNTLKTSPANYPAFDYSTGKRRLLLEGATTQLIQTSNTFSSWNNPGALVTVSQNAIDPAGNANSAWTLTQNGADGTDARLQFNVSVASSTLDYTNSIYIQKTSGNPTTFPALTGFSNGGGSIYVAVVNTTTGEIISNATAQRFGIVDGGNGFWRVFVLSANASGTTMVLQIYPAWTSSFTTTKSTKLGGSVVIYGGMMAQEPGLTSYIGTSGSQVTRIADLCAFSPLLNLCLVTQAATMAWRGDVKTIGTAQQLMGISGNYAFLRAANTTPAALTVEGSTISSLNMGDISVGALGTAFGWDSSGRVGSANGAAVVTTANPVDRTIPPLFFGQSNGLTTNSAYALGAFIAWPLKGTNSNIQAQARVYA